MWVGRQYTSSISVFGSTHLPPHPHYMHPAIANLGSFDMTQAAASNFRHGPSEMQELSFRYV